MRCPKVLILAFTLKVVNASGHSSAVDWWELGIFLYELTYGFTPFRGAHREQTFDNVLHKPLSFPVEPAVSKHCQSIIRALLVRDPSQRLGAKGGAEEVKAHAFFSGLDFGLIRSMPAPFLPPLPDAGARSVPSEEETIFMLDA
jgi:phototropin